MRPNANSGCCTPENATPTRNLHTTYALTPASPLHSQTKQSTYQHQQQQQPQNYAPHHFHTQKQQHQLHHHHQQQFFQPQSAFLWLPQQQIVYNAAQHSPHTTNKNVHIGRHQPPIPFGPHTNSSTLNQNQKQQQHQMPPPALIPTLLQPQQLKYNQHPKHHQQPPHHAQQNSFAHQINGFPTLHMRPPESSVAPTSTIATPLHPPNFSKQQTIKSSTALVNQQRVNECAGIPLISNATAHLAAAQRQRIQRKLSHSPVPLQKLPTTAAAAAAGQYMARNTNTASCTHISQLAAHAQGVPLLLHNQQDQQTAAAATKWSMPCNGTDPHQKTNVSSSVATFTTPSSGTGGKTKTEKSTRNPLRHQHSAPAALSARSSSREHTSHLATQESRTSAELPKENDDECGDMILPRIIKPRKRRKKDRKSLSNGMLLKLDALSASNAPMETDRSRQLVQQQSQLLPKQQQHRQCQQQYWTAQEKANQNINALIDIYAGNHHPTESGSSARTFNTNPFQLDCGFLQPSSLNATAICLKQAGVKQCNNSQDNLGVCFCRDCDPLRSIWDYPLRRSLSDSSAASSIRTHSSSASSTSSTTSSQTSTAETASSSCSGLTAQLSDDAKPTTATPSRLERVGVIGSQRHTQDRKRDAAKPTTNGCLSDSNDSHDSGYGDILSGINIADDFFSQNSYNLTAALTPLLEVTTDLSLNVCSTPATAYQATKSASELRTEAVLPPFLPATADALLSESIKEISRKLIETCGSELPNELSADVATTRSLSAYSRCSSDFSNDSGIDSAAIINSDELIFKFENLNFMMGDISTKNALDVNNHGNTMVAGCDENVVGRELAKLPTTAANIAPTNRKLDFLLNEITHENLQADFNNNIDSEKLQTQRQYEKQKQHNQQFVNNCFDLVWPTTFENCLTKPLTKTLDLNGEQDVMGWLSTYSEVA